MDRLTNRYRVDEPDDDDDIDMEEWLEMSEEEQDRELDIAMQQYVEYLDTLTPAQRYRRSRRIWLGNCMGTRILIRKSGFEFLRENLRRSQLGLVKLRIQRATGVYPGEA